MTRHERYRALKAANARLGWHLLGDAVSERSIFRAAGVASAWDRIGRLVYPMDGDYPAVLWPRKWMSREELLKLYPDTRRA